MATKGDPKLWERRPDETPKPYEAFCIYRDMGTDRSLRAVAEKLEKSETLMGRWSSRYEWVKRATAWDDEQERMEREIAQKEQAKAIRKMRGEHAKLASDMLIKAAEALSALPATDIKPSDITRMVDVASKLERISRGDVGEVIEERNGGDTIPAVQIYLPDNGRGKTDTFDDLEV